MTDAAPGSPVQQDAGRPDWLALGVLALGACAIGFSPIFVRLTETGPAAAAVWRLGLAAPVLLLMSWRAGRGAEGEAQGPTPLALLAGLFFACDLGFWHYGIKLTTVANATILCNLSPVFVTLGAWLMFRERPARMFLAGLVLALIGAWMIASAKGGGQGLNPPLGDALSVATAGWYAAYMLTVRRARARQSASRIMLWTSVVGVPVLLAVALVFGETIMPASMGGWLACLGLAAVHVAGQGAITWSLGRLPAAVASVVVLLQPVLAGLLGWAIFAEALTDQQLVGAAAALTGVVLAQLAAARRTARTR